jgi:hypothetical protein
MNEFIYLFDLKEYTYIIHLFFSFIIIIQMKVHKRLILITCQI